MKNIILLAALLLSSVLHVQAQQFINKAEIEYEVKTNVRKTMGNNMWAEMIKDNMPPFKTGYYLYTFADNKSIYKFDHWDPKAKIPEFLRRNDEDNRWFFDHEKGRFSMQKLVFGSSFYVEDSILPIEWKLETERRIIAGFNCRKAVGKILDSVYVFAYYTDEILIPGGPCSISGLPGMILGLTIPRIYTSWIATKIMVNDVVLSNIKPVTAKKYYTYHAMESTIKERVKDWVRSDDLESKKWMEQLMWNTML